jgi:Zn-dependent protease
MLLLKLKWVAGALKSVVSMAAMLGVYSALYGWRFALGFTLQLLVHELGHVFVAWRYGLPVSAPMFIPFVGALILLKERPDKARTEAWMALGGPMAGGAVAVLLHGAGVGWTRRS